MPTKPTDRLLFAQGGVCFFCQAKIPDAEVSVEHLIATANGGGNSDENCVVCCKTLNLLLGRMSLKEKLRVVLNQKGPFKCPNKQAPVAKKSSTTISKPPVATNKSPNDRLSLVIANLRKHGAALPRSPNTLTNTIHTLFAKHPLPSQEVASLISKLQAKGLITITDDKITYHLPSDDAAKAMVAHLATS